MYTVKQAAQMTGVAPSTVRAWEQRYAVIVPERSPSGYRLYDEGAIRRLRLMSSLIAAGWSAAQAAERVKSDEAAPAADAQDETPGVAVEPFPPVDALVEAAEHMDGALLTATLDRAFALTSFETTVTEWLLPAVVELGRAWEQGRVTIAGEHFVTAALQRRISMAYEAAGSSTLRPRVLVGLPMRCRHELGALMFATLVRRLNVACRFLGEDLPPEAWSAAVAAVDPVAVVVVTPTASDVAHAAATVETLQAQHPSLLVFAGGQHQDDVAGATPLGHDIVAAAAALAEHVRAQPADA